MRYNWIYLERVIENAWGEDIYSYHAAYWPGVCEKSGEEIAAMLYPEWLFIGVMENYEDKEMYS